ncbi:MAG TPA: phosphoenolpyruvate carboxylase [Gammaproteobacteria bacterium]|jgi:phosphoenolpyruvate carboxylase
MSPPKPQPILRSDIVFAQKDKALRDDVRRLGELVGELVREQGGEALFDLVEAARRAAIAHREGDQAAFHELNALLAALEPRTAGEFIRAFSTYFEMVNMAEKVHRIRRRREYLQDKSTPQPFGFLDVLKRLQTAGTDLNALERVIERIVVEPVFTGQPKAVTRRTLLRKQQNIARHLVEMLDPYMTPQELAAALGQIRQEMTTGWQTENETHERGVTAETEHLLFFLTDVLYRVIPPLYESLEEALVTVYGSAARRVRLPVLVKFGSWVGGDMTAHPSVTAKSIRETLARHRALVLELYYEECRELARALTQSDTRIAVNEDLRTRSALYAGHFPQAANALPARHRNMPYRVFLRLMAARLQATYDDAAFPYESPDDFVADVELIASSLRAHHGQNAGLFAVKRLLRRAQTFGFHLATMDLRQNADVQRRIIGTALMEPQWLALPGDDRAARIRDALERRESPRGALNAEARKVLGVFQTIAHCRRKYGRASIGPYVVGMTRGPDDVLSALLLARWGHLGAQGADVPIDIAPLFETVEDLANAAETLRALLRDELYRRHLRARGNQQVVMLGYADSSEGGGMVAVCWSLRIAQQRLLDVAQEQDVRVSIFHGRGGTISRSAGHLHDAVLASLHGAVAGRLRMIEEGEIINAKYGLRGIAMRTLEQTMSSLLWVTAQESKRHEPHGRWQEIMNMIAAGSSRAYRELFDAADLEPYFRAATPIDVLERAGTNKQKMYDEDAVDGSSAIQREFAWAQNRMLLPSWFGFAAGVVAAVDKFGPAEVEQMFAEWSFARVVLAEIEIALAKVDLDVAARYSELAEPLHAKFFPLIRAEFERSVELVLRATRQAELLERSDTLRRAIRLRNPYMDPMSLLQVSLLQRWREGGRQDDDVLTALLASINGIANGMQNTG